MRLIAQIGMGAGALAVIGGTVAIVAFVTLSGASLVAIQGFSSLGNIGVGVFTGFFAALVNVRIAAPVVTGIALAATVGAGATAELGAMRISEEIDALEVMGVKSIAFLSSTRIIAAVVVILPLYGLAMIMAFLSPQLVTTLLYGQSSGTYNHYFRTFLRPDDVFWSFLGRRRHRAHRDDHPLLLRLYRRGRSGRRRRGGRQVHALLAGCGGDGGHACFVGAVRRRPQLQPVGVAAMATQSPENAKRNPPFRTVAAVGVLVLVLVAGLVFVQFRGGFTRNESLTLIADRAGLLIGTGSKVTLNGVEIGKVAGITETERDGKPAAKFALNISPKYFPLIPVNVDAAIKATTVFGGKYVALASPKQPGAPSPAPT